MPPVPRPSYPTLVASHRPGPRWQAVGWGAELRTPRPGGCLLLPSTSESDDWKALEPKRVGVPERRGSRRLGVSASVACGSRAI